MAYSKWPKWLRYDNLFLWFIQVSHKELMSKIEKCNSHTLKFKFLLKWTIYISALHAVMEPLTFSKLCHWAFKLFSKKATSNIIAESQWNNIA